MQDLMHKLNNPSTLIEGLQILKEMYFPLSNISKEEVAAMAAEWVDSNLYAVNLCEGKLEVSWDRSYRAEDRFTDYINSGHIKFIVSEKNLWQAAQSDDYYEGDYEFHHYGEDSKHGDDSYYEYWFKVIGGRKFNHKSLLVSQYKTITNQKYPVTLLGYLKGEVVPAPSWATKDTDRYHKITNYEEIPMWILDTKEEDWFRPINH